MSSLKCNDSTITDITDAVEPALLADGHTLIDTHVHIYECFDTSALLDSAWDNFQQQASNLGLQTQFTGMLLLTESRGYSWFQTVIAQLKQGQQPPWSTRWKFHLTGEPCSLKASNDQGRVLYLIAGRQIITVENLEVLALITDQDFPDGLSTETTIQNIQAAGGIAVLPWGVGKWLSKRGQLVEHLLQQQHLSPIFLGDNSGRPRFWQKPSYFDTAEQLGQQILAGTDPLPLASEVSRPGSFGLSLNLGIDPECPGQQLKSYLLSSQDSWEKYGELETPWCFLRNQTALRMNSQSPTQSAIPTAAMTNSPSSTDFPETADIETSSADYATRFAGAIGTWLLQVQEAATLKMLKPYPNAKVLDVGGGHGQLTKALIEGGYQVTVLGSAEACKTRIQPYLDQQQCSFQVGNVLDMPYPDKAFDVVISYRFLAHVTQWETFLAELARVAKQAVLVDYPTVRSINYITPLLFKLKKGLEGNTRPYTCYRETDITKQFQSLNFMPTDRYAQFALPMVIHRALKQPKISSLLENCIRLTGITHWLGSPVILKVSRS